METESHNNLERAAAKDLQRWQLRLQPFMAIAIAALAVFFLVASVIQLDKLGDSIGQHADTELVAAIATIDNRVTEMEPIAAAELKRWKVLALMERDIVRQRYGGASSIMLLSAWTRQMGFITGMILTFIGAVFILGKMNDSGTQLSGEGTGLKGSLTTSSPGIVLCVLGTILMLVTLNIKTEFQTFDNTVYLSANSAAISVPVQTLDSTTQNQNNEDALPSEIDASAEKPAATSQP
ncbi:MAG: hypothetical protein KA365_07725 [Arenimonas sp.]|nr:hypothetical protein [Arenimonas sp.]MBP6309771.1 hypothetical protein [Arenimonas sp.]